jgi:hypothetical protein
MRSRLRSCVPGLERANCITVGEILDASCGVAA